MNRPSNHITDAELYTGSVARLASLFYDDLAELGRFEPVSAGRAARRLSHAARAQRTHDSHARSVRTSSLVDVRALAEWRDEASYARNSLLARQTDGAILQFGIMRIWLADLPAAARDEITVQRLPLGRVLIDHNLLREVELITLWRIAPGPALRRHLQASAGQADLRPLGPDSGRRAADRADAGNCAHPRSDMITKFLRIRLHCDRRRAERLDHRGAGGRGRFPRAALGARRRAAPQSRRIADARDVLGVRAAGCARQAV